MSDTDMTNKHVDEFTLLMYVERQLDRDAAQEVSIHTQTCTRCLTLLRALDRESRLLTRSMLEQDEELPARLAEFHVRVKKSMQWIWGVVFGLAVLGAYALYTTYIEPWALNLEQAGFGGSNLISLLVFQGAFWKGWQSMFTLVEFVAIACLAGFGLFAIRRYLRRGPVIALVCASMGLLTAFANPVSAAEFRKGQTVRIEKDEVIKSDLFATSENIRVEGTVDGDLYAAGKQIEVSGHVTGDVICACQSVRISGQVDGNVRNASNNLTITGTVGRSVTSFTETFNVDRGAKIGYNLTSFSQILTLDGTLGRDLLAYFHEGNIEGSIGGEMRAKGDSLNIDRSASISGRARFVGHNPAHVATGAKLSSPIEYEKLEHKAGHERGSGYYVWRVIWASAFVILGLVLLSVTPQFSREAALNVENAGASIGLGVLVGFAMPIAAIFACVTVVGLFVGIWAFLLWIFLWYFAQVIVGTAVGQWIVGRTNESWPLIGRMVIGVVLIRIGSVIPFIGFWFKVAVIIWGIGAISLAVYRRLQPVMAPNIPPVPTSPMGNPLPPNTTVGGM